MRGTYLPRLDFGKSVRSRFSTASRIDTRGGGGVGPPNAITPARPKAATIKSPPRAIPRSMTTDLILARSRPCRLDPVMQRIRRRGMARGFAQQADQRIGMDQECARHGVGRDQHDFLISPRLRP